MKTTSLAVSAILALASLTTPSTAKELVISEKLQKLVTLDKLLAGSQKLQGFADANGGHRAFGSAGHNQTVDWIYRTLKSLDYYNVVKQPFSEIYSEGTASVKIDGKNLTTKLMTYSPGGAATGSLVLANHLGCKAEDYPSEVVDKVVLISRGSCSFGDKSLAAKSAGVAGLIIYNNQAGTLSGTLGTPLLDYAPTVGISQEDAKPILDALKVGEVDVGFHVKSTVERRVNFNVIAETKGGDHNNVLILGAHTDSVPAGPGINDDGSGTVAVLRVAEALSKFQTKNAVRFAFWGAEEFGKLGSYYYVKQLNSSESEISKLRAYLNFDMIASPNHVYGIYDGDGSAFNLTGPPGSAAIEKEFETYYRAHGQPFVPSAFSGRSDYAAFIENGIPSGGLFTGAEVLKTADEAKLFGGEAGVAYDINYHQKGDDITNLNKKAYLLNSKSIANSVAKYARSFESLETAGAVGDTKGRKRWAEESAGSFFGLNVEHHEHDGPCGGGGVLM